MQISKKVNCLFFHHFYNLQNNIYNKLDEKEYLYLLFYSYKIQFVGF